MLIVSMFSPDSHSSDIDHSSEKIRHEVRTSFVVGLILGLQSVDCFNVFTRFSQLRHRPQLRGKKTWGEDKLCGWFDLRVTKC